MKFCLLSKSEKVKARAGHEIAALLKGGDTEGQPDMDKRYYLGEFGNKSNIGVFEVIAEIVDNARVRSAS